MKVRETEDRFGKACIVFSKSANINDIHEYLNQHYSGYQFAIVLDESHEEYEELDEVCVNFFGDLADEAIEANGDMYSLSGTERRKIQQFIRDHGSTWSEVVK